MLRIVCFIFLILTINPLMAMPEQDIRELQERLVQQGYSVKFIDGNLGLQTQGAMAIYAQNNGLKENPYVILNHLRGASNRDSIKEAALLRRIEKLEKDLAKQIEDTAYVSDADPLMNREDTKTFVSSELSNTFITMIVGAMGVLISFGGFYVWMRNKIRNDINEHLATFEDSIKKRRDEVINDTNKRMEDQQNFIYGVLTGRLGLLIYFLRQEPAFAELTQKLPIVDEFTDKIQSEFTEHAVKDLRKVNSIDAETVRKKMDLLSNTLFYDAEALARNKRSPTHRINEFFIPCFNYVTSDKDRTIAWAQRLDNVVYCGVIAKKIPTDEALKWLQEAKLILKEKDFNHLISIYPKEITDFFQ